ncbi:MAG: replication initiation protein [Paraclostridium dentum]|uniref:replication initiation protein n=1 Tax=Paraclostridium dentum TaxID=2662455 RepID=UPI003EE510E7
MEEKQEILMKHNDLVKSRYNITLNENRLFIYILYKLQRESKGVLSCEISREELVKFIKGRTDSSTRGLKNMLTSLRKKEINIKTLLDDGAYVWSSYGFINGWDYFSKTDSFRIEASERIYTLLHEYLKEGYTPVNLNIWLTLKNSYAQRFYELLRLWSSSKNSINYKVSELRELLILENKYPKYSELRKRVIIPAINELNSTGYFEISYDENKKGRNIESIDFYVKDLDKRKYFTKDGMIKEIPDIEREEIAITCNNKEEITLNDNVTMEPEIISNIEVNKLEIFIPDESVFTKGTLRSFKKDFKDIDFKNDYMERAFDDAVMITLDRDDVETIKATSYKFFKGTLDNKIVEYKLEEKEDLDHKKEMDTFW